MVSRTITIIALSIFAIIATLSKPVETTPLIVFPVLAIPCIAYLVAGATYFVIRHKQGHEDKMRRDVPPPACTIPSYLSACHWGVDSTVHKNDDNSIVIDGLPADCFAQMTKLTEAQAKEAFHGKVTVLNKTAIQLSHMPKNFFDALISNAKTVV